MVDLAYESVVGTLRDPASASFTDVRVHDGAPTVVCGKVNARNGFGGMGGPKRFIRLLRPEEVRFVRRVAGVNAEAYRYELVMMHSDTTIATSNAFLTSARTGERSEEPAYFSIEVENAAARMDNQWTLHCGLTEPTAVLPSKLPLGEPSPQ